MGRVAKPYDH